MPRALFATTYLDHRGTPFTLARRVTIYRRVLGTIPGNYWLMRFHARLLLPLLSIVILLNIDKPLHGWVWIVALLWIALLLGRVIVYSCLPRSCLSTRLSALSTHLLTYGRCGACATDLLDTPVAADGCSVCPACKAAWRKDAFTHTHLEPCQDQYLKRLIPCDSGSASSLTHDDRAILLASGIAWPLPWLGDRTVPEATRRTIKAHASKRLRRLIAWILPIALLLWGGCLWAIFKYTNERDAGTIVIASMAILIVLWLIAYVIGRLWMDKAMHAFASHYLNACNHCGQALPNTPPEFDGCRVCAKCGAAWKAGAHTTPDTEPATA